MKKLMMVAAVAICLVGCAGTKVDTNKALQVRPGMTGRQVVALMGEPSQKLQHPDGLTTWQWSHADLFSRSSAYIVFDGDVVVAAPSSVAGSDRAAEKQRWQSEDEVRLYKDAKRRETYLAAHPDLPQPIAEAIRLGTAEKGMSRAQLEAAMGKPRGVETSSGEWGTLEVWGYASLMVSMIDGKVTGWQTYTPPRLDPIYVPPAYYPSRPYYPSRYYFPRRY